MFHRHTRYKSTTVLVMLLTVITNSIEIPYCGCNALAQAVIRSPGLLGSSALGGTALLGSTDNLAARRHRSPTGKFCITAVGGARPQKVNPQIFNHIVLATNACGQEIKINVCYYRSEHCVPIYVPAYSDKEVVLGIMPSMSTFRFEFREVFNTFGLN